MKIIVRALVMRKRISRYMLQRVYVAVGNREYGICKQETWTTKNKVVRPSESKALPDAFWPNDSASAGTETSTSQAHARQEAKERSRKLRNRLYLGLLQRRLLMRGRSIRIMVN